MNQRKEIILKVKRYFELGIIVENKAKKRLALNYLNKARHNLLVAKLLLEATKSKKVLGELGFPDDFKAFDWIIDSGYYGMYMAAQSGLAVIGIKCENHTATPYALEYFFVFKGKLEQGYVDLLRKHQEILVEEDIDKLKEGRELRLEAQYNVSRTMEENMALTLLKEAGEFIERIEQLVEVISKEDNVI